MQQHVQEGDFITVVYDGILDNGEIFETSSDTGPLEFTVGLGNVMAAFENGVLGMCKGETREIKVSPEEGFGPHNPELTQTIDRDSLGTNIEPKIGMVLGMTLEKDGQTHQVPAMVVDISGDQVIVDYNHPLAGRELTYRITVKDIKAPGIVSADQACGCN
ncbi:MAG: peptidylprolyl isomerase [Proteobacteria bacterium]|nr:peptidylprolyl isomerase [Pseudomonadota bacterium]MBU1736621.1 peptidylprolyl isomerase [Pseudomonadota bacterium]